MKYLIVGDPHLKPTNLAVGGLLFKLMEQEAQTVDAVIILGDLFDTFSIIRSEVLNAWTEYLSGISVPHVLIVGNHDLAKATSHEVHSLKTLHYLDKVHVVDRPMEFKDVFCVPYYKTEEDFKIAIAKSSKSILICHQSFDGAQFENGFFDPDGIKVEAVKKFDYVISGHIHSEQYLPSAKIWFPGTPFQHNFSDAGSFKGIFILDTDTWQVTRIELDAPRYIQIEGSAEEVLSRLDTLEVKNYHKMIVRDTIENINQLNDNKRFRQALKDFHIKKFDDVVKVKAPGLTIRDSIEPTDMLKEYIYNMLDTTHDRDELFELARGLLNGR